MELTMPRGGARPGSGRPRKFGRAKLSEPTLIHGTLEMKAAWKRAATAAGKPTSDWIRDTLNAAAGI